MFPTVGATIPGMQEHPEGHEEHWASCPSEGHFLFAHSKMDLEPGWGGVVGKLSDIF